jgi:N-acetylglucosamine malate deacetylase 2
MNDRCLIVAPHPDDETIGAGIWMDRRRVCEITVLHVTDGSPRDLADARAAGFGSQRAYAEARRQEVQRALIMVGVGPRQLRAFHFVDKEVYLHLPELIGRLAALVDELQPDVVMAPAYEGGHPDHDSAALAVATARARVARPFRHREYPLYHAGAEGDMVTDAFLTDSGGIEVCWLSPEEQEKKRAMLACFTTQQHILSKFTVEQESFRDAPAYDFISPPHPGKLLYEYWNFGVTRAEWRTRVEECFVECRLDSCLPRRHSGATQ